MLHVRGVCEHQPRSWIAMLVYESMLEVSEGLSQNITVMLDPPAQYVLNDANASSQREAVAASHLGEDSQGPRS